MNLRNGSISLLKVCDTELHHRHTCDSHTLVEFVDNDREDRWSANQQARPGSHRAAREPIMKEDAQADTEYTPELDQNPLDQLQDLPHDREIQADVELDIIQPDLPHYSPEQSFVHAEYKSPSQLSKRRKSDLVQSPSLLKSASQSLVFRASWPCETQHEAILFHYYIKVLAPWVGNCLSLLAT